MSKYVMTRKGLPERHWRPHRHACKKENCIIWIQDIHKAEPAVKLCTLV
jgi:hypothetical protein